MPHLDLDPIDSYGTVMAKINDDTSLYLTKNGIYPYG